MSKPGFVTGFKSTATLGWQAVVACMVLAGAMGVPTARSCFAHTNRDQVRRNIREGWDQVIWSQEIDHAEYGKLAVAVAASVAADNPMPMKVFFAQLAVESVGCVGRDVIVKIVAGNGRCTVRDGIQYDCGIATYNHWTDERIPDGIRWHGLHPSVIWKTVRVPRPNTHQPYIRIRAVRCRCGMGVRQ